MPAAMLTWPIYTSTTNRPIPTNDWWTDLLVSKYAGTMWALPLAVSADAQGLSLCYGTNWNGTGRTMLTEYPLRIEGSVPPPIETNDILLADFEGGAYPAGWTRSGSAFGAVPSTGSAVGQSQISGFVGAGLVNTYFPNDGATGTLRSTDFLIARSNLHFLIAGGNWPTQTAARLVVNGAIVRSETGRNSEQLSWRTWDVSPYIGSTGRLELIDSAKGGWGHLCADQFFLSDDPTNQLGKWSTSFLPKSASATDWSDWLVSFALEQDASRRVDVTMGHGLPFVWLHATGVGLRVRSSASARYFSAGGATVTNSTIVTNAIGLEYAGRTYGLFAPSGTVFAKSGDTLALGVSNTWLVVGVMPDAGAFARFQNFAYAEPTNSTLAWTYDVDRGIVTTDWTLQTRVLQGTNGATLQGWLPHHYRTTSNNLAFTGDTFVTPRGKLKLAAGTSFRLQYPFAGVLPGLPPPRACGTTNDFDPERMKDYLAAGSTISSYGADTYWGGKDIIDMARFLDFAEAMDDETADRLKAHVRAAMEDWLTYTPGETEHYFARYSNWRGLVGFNESYGSGQFTDHHFHYGYFTTTAALLGLHDPGFLVDYGPMITAVAKEYANWDRSDTNFPMFRTFDPWGGHSYAGGFSAAGGNNQESTSEAMQSWGGLFTLGHVLGDTNMMAAGAMGFVTESEAVMEYWNNYYGWRDGASAGTFPPPYTNSIVGILFDDGDAYATYFEADPGWIYGIQWLPPSPFLNYTIRDPVFARYQFTNMMALRDVHVGGAASNTLSQMGAALGNVIIGYHQMFDPEQAIADDTALLAAHDPVVLDTFNAGINYYFMHTNRRLGLPRFDHRMNVPFSQVYASPAGASFTYVAYNTDSNAVLANVYSNDVFRGCVLARPRAWTEAGQLLVTSAPFAVTATYPANGETAAVSQVVLVFSQPVAGPSLGPLAIAGSGISGWTTNPASSGLVVRLDLTGTLLPGAVATVSVSAAAMPSNFVFTFRAPGDAVQSYLQGHYRLDETSGTAAADASPYARDGAYSNGPASVAGATNGTGTAMHFDGTNDFVQLEKAYVYGLNDSFTASAWVKLDSTTGDQPILGTDRRENHKGLQLLARGGKPVLGFYGDETVGTNTLQVGRWYHIAWRYYRGVQSVFVNGRLDSSSAGHENFAGIDALLLGRWGGSATPAHLAGALDDIQIYSRPLTDAEILSLFANPGAVNTNGLQNFAPLVSAGSEQSALFPEPALVAGDVIDDDLPDGNTATLWSKVDGPGELNILAATNRMTEVGATAPGRYTLRFSATDGQYGDSNDVVLWMLATNDARLVLHFRLDETNGAIARDAAGSAIEGAYSNSPALNQVGAVSNTGRAVLFGGNGQGIRIGNPALLNNLTHGFTVSVWVNPASYGGNRVIFGSNWQDQNGWSLRFSGPYLRLERLGPAQTYDSGQTLPLHAWTHVAAVYGVSNDVTFYLDGVAVTNVPGAAAASQATRPWYVAGNGGDWFIGALDDLQVYDRALEANEIALLRQYPGVTLGDSDRDGMDDLWEARHGLAWTVDNGAADADGDGATDVQEFIADTDPQSAESVLETQLQQTNGQWLITARPATNSRQYQWDFTVDVLHPDWIPMSSLEPGQNGEMTFIDPVPSSTARVYRVRAIRP